jgi:mannonate dehydratase
MKISDAKVFVCSPGRNFVTLKIYTDHGVYGLATRRLTAGSWQLCLACRFM